MQSIEVVSWKVPMGLVRRRTSRKRSSMTFSILLRLRSSRVLHRKHLSRSSRPFRRHATALGADCLQSYGKAARGGDRLGPARRAHATEWLIGLIV